MRFIFLLARLYPYWALALCLVFFELGNHFRRREHPARFFCWFMIVVLMTGTILWFVNRGDIHSDRWVRQWLGA